MDTSGDGFLSAEELLLGYRKFYGADFNLHELKKVIDLAD